MLQNLLHEIYISFRGNLEYTVRMYVFQKSGNNGDATLPSSVLSSGNQWKREDNKIEALTRSFHPMRRHR